jgi:hypothetical protein
MSSRSSVLGRPGGHVADDLECLFGGLDRPKDGLLDPEQRESQLILGELEYFLAPLVLKLTPCLEQLAQLRIVGRDLTRELPPGLEAVAASGRVQEKAAGESADLLARSIIELLKPPALLSDFDSAALGKHPDLAQPLASFAQGLCSFRARCLEAGLVQIPLSLSQRPLGVSELIPEPLLALILGLQSRQRIGVLSPNRLGQGLDRLSQKLPCPRSPDVSGKDKKQLRVPIEGFGELYQGLSNGPLDLARLDPADLRSRETAPPRQPPNGEARTHTRRFGHLRQRRLSLILNHNPSLAACVPSVK